MNRSEDKRLPAIISEGILGLRFRRGSDPPRKDIIKLLQKDPQIELAIETCLKTLSGVAPKDQNLNEDDPMLGDLAWAVRNFNTMDETKKGAIFNLANALLNAKVIKSSPSYGKISKHLQGKFGLLKKVNFREPLMGRGGETTIGPTAAYVPSRTWVRHETQKQGNARPISNLSEEQAKGDLAPKDVHPDALSVNQALPIVTSIQDSMNDLSTFEVPRADQRITTQPTPIPEMSSAGSKTKDNQPEKDVTMGKKRSFNMLTSTNVAVVPPPRESLAKKMKIASEDLTQKYGREINYAPNTGSLNRTAYQNMNMGTGQKTTMGGQPSISVMPQGMAFTKSFNLNRKFYSPEEEKKNSTSLEPNPNQETIPAQEQKGGLQPNTPSNIPPPTVPGDKSKQSPMIPVRKPNQKDELSITEDPRRRKLMQAGKSSVAGLGGTHDKTIEDIVNWFTTENADNVIHSKFQFQDIADLLKLEEKGNEAKYDNELMRFLNGGNLPWEEYGEVKDLPPDLLDQKYLDGFKGEEPGYDDTPGESEGEMTAGGVMGRGAPDGKTPGPPRPNPKPHYSKGGLTSAKKVGYETFRALKLAGMLKWVYDYGPDLVQNTWGLYREGLASLGLFKGESRTKYMQDLHEYLLPSNPMDKYKIDLHYLLNGTFLADTYGFGRVQSIKDSEFNKLIKAIENSPKAPKSVRNTLVTALKDIRGLQSEMQYFKDNPPAKGSRLEKQNRAVYTRYLLTSFKLLSLMPSFKKASGLQYNPKGAEINFVIPKGFEKELANIAGIIKEESPYGADSNRFILKLMEGTLGRFDSHPNDITQEAADSLWELFSLWEPSVQFQKGHTELTEEERKTMNRIYTYAGNQRYGQAFLNHRAQDFQSALQGKEMAREKEFFHANLDKDIERLKGLLKDPNAGPILFGSGSQKGFSFGPGPQESEFRNKYPDLYYRMKLWQANYPFEFDNALAKEGIYTYGLKGETVSGTPDTRYYLDTSNYQVYEEPEEQETEYEEQAPASSPPPTTQTSTPSSAPPPPTSSTTPPQPSQAGSEGGGISGWLKNLVFPGSKPSEAGMPQKTPNPSYSSKTPSQKPWNQLSIDERKQWLVNRGVYASVDQIPITDPNLKNNDKSVDPEAEYRTEKYSIDKGPSKYQNAANADAVVPKVQNAAPLTMTNTANTENSSSEELQSFQGNLKEVELPKTGNFPLLRAYLQEGGADVITEINKDSTLEAINRLVWQQFNNGQWEANEEADNPLHMIALTEDCFRFSGELDKDDVLGFQAQDAIQEEYNRNTHVAYEIPDQVMKDGQVIVQDILPEPQEPTSAEGTDMLFHDVYLPPWIEVPEDSPWIKFTTTEGTQIPDTELENPNRITGNDWPLLASKNSFIQTTLS